ncbi:Predicted DNA binding protein, contains HTH domain [Halogranum amylolyticum]|uniref:Predicted DNA binding protein, contains HTH domain n=1 Tax=Halogranum amylolyticum TaxID=660520 RepID=A0A1H8US14_9EURY|nr:helix-turn-helix domain-containing protein [Halogranum amylolyticum]SEP05787.1 Predicted DNA binding protein, contains HTH domain [Halogranum amylolyticum]
MSVVLAEISVPSDSFQLGEVLNDYRPVRIELTQLVPTGEMLAPYFWAEAEDYAAFEESVRRDPRVGRLREVDVGPDKRLYHIEWADTLDSDGFLQALRSHDVIVESAVGTDDTWQFRLRAATHESLASFQQACTDSELPLTVHRVSEPASDAYDLDGLTSSQREALVVASRRGYFETPSRVSLKEIGDELGITPQAASKRIRGGVETLVTNAVSVD